MDPISAIASVAGVITLVAQSLNLTREYINRTKESVNLAAAFQEELEALSSNLQRLKQYLQKDTALTGGFGHSSVLMTRISACQTRVSAFNDRMEKIAGSRWKQASWPYSLKQHRETMQALRDFSQWIHFSLSINTAELLSKTSQDVMGLLTAQLRSLEHLDSLETRTISLENTLDAQSKGLRNAEKGQERKEILNWLSDYDHERKHLEISSSRTPGTGEWLLDTEHLRNWLAGSDTVLWCHGVQGCGKSVLT